LLRIEPDLLSITTCSLVTILIILTQLPLLGSSWFVFLFYTMEKALHVTAFISTQYVFSGLLLLIAFWNLKLLCKWTVGL